jgi:hypothetical protein
MGTFQVPLSLSPPRFRTFVEDYELLGKKWSRWNSKGFRGNISKIDCFAFQIDRKKQRRRLLGLFEVSTILYYSYRDEHNHMT